MKRALAIVLFAATALAAGKPYDDGLAAIQAKSWSAAAQALQKAITEAPVETPGYLPHYWLGVAKFNLGDNDGALRHWRISENQGAIARTAEYARLKDWIARAQAAKQPVAAPDASAKKAADGAISRALSMQAQALSAGRDRTDGYRGAQRKLQDALARFHKGAYAEAQKLAEEAGSGFGGQPAVITPPPVVVTSKSDETTPPAAESAARVNARLALQSYRRAVVERNAREELPKTERLRAQLERATTDAALQRIAREATDRHAALMAKQAPAPVLPASNELEPAWRHFAGGRFDDAESLLSSAIATKPTAQALAMRGCTRYTKAVLARAATDAAAADFREALKLDRGLRLDRKTFSPKLVAFFEQVRGAR